MKNYKILLILLISLTYLSCSSVRVTTDYNSEIDFSSYKTYAFSKKGIDKAKINELDKKRILKDAVKLHSKKVETICERQGKINGYEHRIHWGYDSDYNDYKTKLENICREELTKQFRKSTKEGQELDKIDNKVNNLLMTLSYPNLVAEEVDLNKALEDGSSMLSIALNPNTLKQISN